MLAQRSDSRANSTPTKSLCPVSPFPTPCTYQRSRPCPAQVTLQGCRQVANFCPIISWQLRRLTGLEQIPSLDFPPPRSLCPPSSTHFPTQRFLPWCPKLQLLPEIPSGAILEVSRGPTASSRVCACPQLIGRLHPDTVQRFPSVPSIPARDLRFSREWGQSAPDGVSYPRPGQGSTAVLGAMSSRPLLEPLLQLS